MLRGVLGSCREKLLPSREEQRVVAGPEPSGEFRLSRSAPHVGDEGAGLVHRPITLPAELEAEIDVLVVRRRVHRVETADFAERPAADEKAGGRSVIELAGEKIFRLVRVITESVELCVTVAEEEWPGLLERLIEVQEPRSDGRDVGVHAFPQKTEPAGVHEGVAVQKDEQWRAREGRPLIARRSEAAVRSIHD